MNRSLLSPLFAVCSAALMLAGCNGGSYDDLREAPPAFQRDSGNSRVRVADCISGNLMQFGSDLGRFPDIEPGTTRLTLGGDDHYHYRNYYQIDIVDQNSGSHVAVRRTKWQDASLSMTDLSRIVEVCVE